MSDIKSTVSDVLTIISDLRGESSVNTDASRIRAVSRANKDFAKRRFWKFYRREDTDTGDGGNDYTVGDATNPARFKGLSEVFVNGTTEDRRHEIVDLNKYKSIYNSNNSYRMAYEYYDEANDIIKMYINPAPATGATINYTYYWTPPTLTSTTDAVICPNNRIIALLALADLLEGEEEINKARAYKEEAEQLIGEIEGIDSSPAVNQIYTMGSIENSVRDRGIGSY